MTSKDVITIPASRVYGAGQGPAAAAEPTPFTAHCSPVLHPFPEHALPIPTCTETTISTQLLRDPTQTMPRTPGFFCSCIPQFPKMLLACGRNVKGPLRPWGDFLRNVRGGQRAASTFAVAIVTRCPPIRPQCLWVGKGNRDRPL